MEAPKKEWANTPIDTDELINAVETIGDGFTAIGQGFEAIAALLRGTPTSSESTDIAGAYRIARQLERRLGMENQELLFRSAQNFPPGVKFTLTELADVANITPRSARARLMNIGRSLKAIGGRNVLWRTRRDEESGHTIYHWTAEGHAAALQVFAE